MENHPQKKWRSVEPVLFAYWPDKPCDDCSPSNEVVLYVPSSGNTHLVTRAGAKVLEILQDDKTSSANTLFIKAGQDKSLTLGVNSSAEFEELYLYSFEDLGLIEQISD